MNFLRYILLFACLLVGFSSLAQQMNQKIDMILDEQGNAQIKMSMTMNAQAWQTWIQSVGNNPAGLKRSVEREMPAYFLDDFKLEKNDMERSFELSLKAYGVCKVDKRGNWILETDDKNVQLTELTERKYMYVASPPEMGGQVQQTYMIEFPEAAQNIEVEEDAFGKTIFEFDMALDTPSGGGWLRWSGLGLMLLGLAWLGVGMVKK